MRFDRVIFLRPGGVSSVQVAGNLAPGSVSWSGSTLTAIIPEAMLPSNGFANKLDYTWNLWPRDGAGWLCRHLGLRAQQRQLHDDGRHRDGRARACDGCSDAGGVMGLLAWRRRSI